MKLIYIVAAVAMLAMLIPAMALPVSAADGMAVVLATTDGAEDGGYENGDENWVGYNVWGNYVDAILIDAESGDPMPDGTVDSWAIFPADGAEFIGDPNGEEDVPSTVRVNATGLYAQVSIEATVGSEKYTATKKWAMIDYTEFSAENGSTIVSYNETVKAYYAVVSLSDTVYGDFPLNPDHPVQGVKLNWYLFDSSVNLSGIVEGEAVDLKDALDELQETKAASFVEFVDLADPLFDPADVTPPYDGWLGTYIQTLTDATGTCTVNFAAWDKESVKIVVIPEYPNYLEVTVVPEITSWNFARNQIPVVPQVRWIGEKIVLERNYTPQMYEEVVNFAITTGSDSARLEAIGPTAANLTSNSRSVWTEIDENGLASVILTCDAAEEVVVDAALYDRPGTNTKFRTFFLKFETINLSDVVGKRSGHNEGVWTWDWAVDDSVVTMYNPYNEYFPATAVGLDPETNESMIEGHEDDVLAQDRNVSEDALERVQVRGWFEGVNDSTRPKAYQDYELADQVFDFESGYIPPSEPEGYGFDITLPEGRWVLPDDWYTLAGGTKNWNSATSVSKYWNIMDRPDDTVTSTDVDGPFLATQATPVVGPFSPGLEVMTPTGWCLTMTSMDEDRQIKTVVPNSTLDAYDAPMPPAKILFEIAADEESSFYGNGFFKETMKADVYVDGTGHYTNPFYSALIPAHWAIPAVGGQGSGDYLWDSFGANAVYEWDEVEEEWDWIAPGPYYFWTIVTKIDADETPSSNVTDYPTAVEVYSDNHGEAMVWLNGDWNLQMLQKGFVGSKDGIDIQDGTIVGETIVRAAAFYPYTLVEQNVWSNLVVKTWYWGGMVLGVDGRSDFADGTSSDASHNILSIGSYLETNEGDAEDPDDSLGTSDEHIAFVWVCDRDGKIDGAIGTEVEWWITNGSFGPTDAHSRLSEYNDITRNIYLGENGFLEGTDGVVTVDGVTSAKGISYMREPTSWERQLFFKNWPDLYDDPTGVKEINFAVAAIDVYSSQPDEITVDVFLSGEDFGYTEHSPGKVYYTINIPLYDGEDKVEYPLDDPILPGDANLDGEIDAADITAVERIILGLDTANINGDTNSNGSIDMGDVVKIIRIIRGLD